MIIESSRAAFIKSWHHEERTEKFKRLEKTNVLRICAAVTAACCLLKRETFLEVGGFDEMWFPVAFSDTALAVKIRARGLHCFYTPLPWESTMKASRARKSILKTMKASPGRIANLCKTYGKMKK